MLCLYVSEIKGIYFISGAWLVSEKVVDDAITSIY